MKEAKPPQAAGEVKVEIMCFIPADEGGGLATGFLKYRLPLEKAKEKVLQLVDDLVKGKVEGFNVTP